MNQELIDRLKGKTLDDQKDVELISTGCYALNRIISGDYSKGLPVGRIVQLQGNSSTGKTLFATTFLAAAQKAGWYTKMLDAENTFSKGFGTKLGIDPKGLLYSTPTNLEEAFEDVESTMDEIRALDKDTPILITIDSVAVLPTREETERESIGEISNTDGARRALVFGSLLRKISHKLEKGKTTLLVINQIRSKINVMYGNPDTTAAGGRSLEFYISVDLKTTSNKTSDVVKDDKTKQPIGIIGEIECKKNKVGIPFQKCEFKVLFDQGLDPYYGLAPLLANDGYIIKNESSGRLSIGNTKFAKDDFTSVLMDKNCADTAIIRKMLGIEN
jgi:recombination protein RecA